MFNIFVTRVEFTFVICKPFKIIHKHTHSIDYPESCYGFG